MIEGHAVAFIDLLGFKDVINSRDDAAKEAILGLLTDLAGGAGNSRMTRMPAEGLGTRTTWRPSVSAFSDNLVLSAPTSMLRAFGSPSTPSP